MKINYDNKLLMSLIHGKTRAEAIERVLEKFLDLA
jgi:hypothetical protein